MDSEKNIVEALKELIRQTTPENGHTDQAGIKAIIDEQIKNVKIKRSNLDNDVLEMLSKPLEVRITLPSLEIVTSTAAAQIPYFMKVIDDLYAGNNVYLWGEAGTGKTTLAEEVAAVMKREYVTINCNQWTSPIDLKGGQTIEGYKEGALIEAWRDGKMLILDELPKLDPNTAGILNDALAKTDRPPGTLIFNGLNQPIKKHRDFCCIASGNTTGKGTSPRYNGNNKQDLSLLDRFSGSFYEVGFNIPLERSLLHDKVYSICTQIRNEIIKANADEIMTLRTMLNMNRIYRLEMLRELGEVTKVPGGKTMIDCLNSYFSIMNKDKAQLIKTNVNVELYKNTYKDRAAFKNELSGVSNYASAA